MRIDAISPKPWGLTLIIACFLVLRLLYRISSLSYSVKKASQWSVTPQRQETWIITLPVFVVQILLEKISKPRTVHLQMNDTME